MPTNDGKKVKIAFEAIRQCHQDVGRLIADLDAHMIRDKWKRLSSQDAVTWGLSRAAYSPYWMAQMIYRQYCNKDVAHDIVDGINIRFFSDDKTLAEPRIVIGRAKYEVPANKSLSQVAQTWDFDEGFEKWYKAQADDMEKILSFEKPERAVRKMCIVALDLYSITSFEQVTNWLVKVRQQCDATESSNIRVP